jgi:ABC-type transport system involved in multi-copper enzyme maturation permease subunit
VAKAKAEAQAQYQQSLQETNREIQECQAAQGTPKASDYPPKCEISPPSPSDIDPQWFMPASFEFRSEFPSMVTTFAAVLALVAYIIGASFVGAEWSSGGMMNLLLWRPRRVQVLGTKLAVLLAGTTVLTVVLGAIWTTGFYGIAMARGSTAKMTSGAWQSIALMEARALALVLVAGALGFGLASIGRHTAMALGVAIGLVIVFQFGLGTALALAKVKFAQAYLLPLWIVAWMKQKYVVEDYDSCNFSGTDGCHPDSFTITWHMAGSALAIAFVVIVGAALWTIRRRDIT